MDIYLPEDEGVEFPREQDVINWAEHDAHAQDAYDDYPDDDEDARFWEEGYVPDPPEELKGLEWFAPGGEGYAG